MKKPVTMLFSLILFVCLIMPTPAADETYDTLPYVTDAALVLSDEEENTLESEAARISEEYQCGVYIITLNDFTADTGESSISAAAKSIYQEYNLGWGEEKSGILLLMDAQGRDYTLSAFGYGNTAFTDYGKEKLSEKFVDNFVNDDWYGGFADYLSKSDEMLKDARAGHPLDVGDKPLIRLLSPVFAIALGLLLALLICGYIDSKMKSVAKKTEASEYVNTDSVTVTAREDSFTHTTTVREKIEKSSSSGGTTVDSDGFSSKSGKF